MQLLVANNGPILASKLYKGRQQNSRLMNYSWKPVEDVPVLTVI